MLDFNAHPALLELVADRFKALSHPARLRVLNGLRGGERSVSELMEVTELGQANLSKHLQLLHSLGFVARRQEGSFVLYRLTDESVFELCQIMCGQITQEVDARRELLART